MRDIALVIEEMKPLVDNPEVITEMDNIVKDAYYQAPELHYVLWNELAGMLNHFYPMPLKNDNQVKLVAIFTGLTEEEVTEKYMEKVEN